MAMTDLRAPPPLPRPPDPPVASALQLARRGAAALAGLSERVHPAWIDSLGDDVEALIRARPVLLNQVLLTHFGLRWPNVALAHQGADGLWLLSAADLRRVCAARALFRWRDTLDRCVVAAVRRAARSLVGDRAFEAIAARPCQRSRGADELPPLEPDSICVQGWAQWKLDRPQGDTRARRLVDLTLPPFFGGAPAAKPDAEEADLFLTDLPLMFPELTWLFGSSRATSR
jgi:hypothetical protein